MFRLCMSIRALGDDKLDKVVGKIRKTAGFDMSLYLEMPPDFQCYESKRQDSEATTGTHDMMGLREGLHPQ